ncbi:hypothetical protein MOQ67_15090 [Pseudomonas sp. LY-1]|jgi:hypothetical protein|uniref:Transmembrane protein n=1 Tax=Pseudomonas veronii TaxID=76761 RepID=A0A7Y0ZSP3_PSEVE|nr:MULTISPECIES: hypothetical protein [Pseudomonas]SEC34007.1 hypothetical protein SAMN04490199_4745 [Pseudomonas marginalis]KRP78431.1 hypothetical protein TU80_12845 [Pseudomonas veronii]MBI6551172.1 hypothetical protein [Pseudomonas veronii]MBI6652229.1 hypothetical protein [Pseudomonas veronii]MCI1739829.1 hypothetical protein [Pseudomonas veronii]
MSVTTEKELADAVNRNEDTIVIEGDLAKKTIRIKATGTVAWAVAIGSICIVFYGVIATVGTGGVATPVAGFAAVAGSGGALSVLGAAATSAAISMAVSVRSLSVLKKLRGNYKIVSESDNKVTLKRS